MTSRKALKVVTAAGVVLSALIGLVTNYITSKTPAPLDNYWVSVPTLAVLVTAVAVLALVALRADTEEQAEATASTAPTSSATARNGDVDGAIATRPTGQDRSLAPPEFHGYPHIRKAELGRLHRMMLNPADRFAVITGAGGMGKSELAKQVAELAARRNLPCFWIGATDTTSDQYLEHQFLQIARQLGLPQHTINTRGGDPYKLVWDRLGETGWVIVIDNLNRVDRLGPQPVADYRHWIRPSEKGLLIVTSRDRESWGSKATVVPLEPLQPANGAAMLLRCARNRGSEKEARALSRRLDGMPLVLHAAAAYLTADKSRDFASYTVSKDGDALQKVADAWWRSLDDLDPLARLLFQLVVAFADAPVPHAVLTPALFTGEVRGPEIPTRPDAEAVARALTRLMRLQLLGVAGGMSSSVTLHSTVREAMTKPPQRDPGDSAPQRDPGDPAAHRRAAQTATLALLAEDSYDATTAQHLIPHVQELFDLRVQSEKKFRTARRAYFALADHLDAVGAHLLELPLRKAVIEGWEARPGEPDRESLADRAGLAAAIGHTGRHQEAYDLHDEVATARAGILGDTDLDTLASRHDLANVLVRLGRDAAAVGLLRQVLAARRELPELGDDHRDTLTTSHDLADALVNSGHYPEGLDLHRRTLAARKTLWGDDDRDTLTSRASLANVEVPETVLALHEEILGTRRRLLGPDHPDTLRSRRDMANAKADVDQLDQAVEEHEILVKDLARVYGKDHPEYVIARGELAVALSQCHDAAAVARALKLCKENVTACKTLVDPRDPIALTAKHNRGVVLTAVGEQMAGRRCRGRHTAAADIFGQAVKELDQCLKDRELVLGRIHRDTRATLSALAYARLRNKQPKAALADYEEVWERCSKFGLEHPDTRAALANLLQAEETVKEGRLLVGQLR